MNQPPANRTSLWSPPLGTRMPGSVHSVTCSIPTMRDVIGYEEKEAGTMDAITSGYPRFVTHFYIRRIGEEWDRRFQLKGRQLFLTSSRTTAREALAFAGDPQAQLLEAEGLYGIHLPAGAPSGGRIRAYMQHVGGGLSSRQAEDYLLQQGLLASAQSEERADPDSAAAGIRQELAGLFGAAPENVHLASSGMSAFFATFRAINDHQQKRGRREWIQLGWLYVDTIEILRKLTGGEHHFLNNVLDLDSLNRLLQERGDKVAGIVTEVPTNPLLQTPDLIRLREISASHGIPLIVDPTLASPYNIDILPLCDVAVNSLTKYAANQGDVMMGAVVVNSGSSWASRLNQTLPSGLIAPYLGDVCRLAIEIRDYQAVMEKINANTMVLTDWLQRHPGVEKVFGAYTGESGKNYFRLQNRPNSPGGVLSIKLRGPVADFYDRVELPKGPSFGAFFTMLCPFIYLAHYDLVSTREGRRQLNANGLDAELLRISLGTEEPERIIFAFEKALGKGRFF